jgi:hypothetical protein
MMTPADRVAREDLVMFINACFACTGQREFYADAAGQRVAVEFLHDYILGNYRLLYARSLAAGINHFGKATAIVRLLATGRDARAEHRAEEGALIAAALAALPTHRAYKVLAALAERRVNNRRARAVIRAFTAGAGARRDLAFEAVKYRRSLRAATMHAHLDLGDERGKLLFSGWRKRRFETPLFESFRAAHYADEALYALPYTIAEGLAARRGVPREVFLRRIEPRLTRAERARLLGAYDRAGEALPIDLAALPPTQLASYLLSLPRVERARRREELGAALDRAAHRAVARTGARFGRVAAVLDASYSSSGSSEKRRRPLAVALAASAFLRASSRAYRAFWTAPAEHEILVEPRGATDLATPILDALAWGADLVLVVSDGVDNDPPGAAGEVLRVVRARLGGPSIVHLNPVFDAEGYAPRALTPAVPTVGLREAEDLPTMVGFARFAAGDASLAELEGYLAARAARFLERGAA